MDEMRVGDNVVTREATGFDPGFGYIASGAGHELRVLYVGSEGDEVGWLYARGKVAGTGADEEGWVQVCKVLPLHRTYQTQCGAGGEDNILTNNRPMQCTSTGVCAPSVEPPTLLGGSPCLPLGSQQLPVALDQQLPVVPDQQLNGKKATIHAVECQRRGELQLLTFGLENCDEHLVNRCMDWGEHGGARARIPEPELRSALHRLGYPHVDMVIDARCFPDYHAWNLSRHIGVHPEILTRLVQHPRFPRYIKSLRHQWSERWQSALQQQKGPELLFVVAVYCRAGKHRSVAVSQCLAHIGKAVQSLEVRDVQHLSRPRWGRNLCKGSCDECRGFSKERQSALEKAEQLWRSCY